MGWSSYLEMSKQERRKKMEKLSSSKHPTNGSDGKLGGRARRWWDQTFNLSSRGWHARRRRWRENKKLPKPRTLTPTVCYRMSESEEGKVDICCWVKVGPIRSKTSHDLTGPEWDWRRRIKRSSKHLVSKKYTFDIVPGYRNSCLDLGWKDSFTHFWPKHRFLGFEERWTENENCSK